MTEGRVPCDWWACKGAVPSSCGLGPQQMYYVFRAAPVVACCPRCVGGLYRVLERVIYNITGAPRWRASDIEDVSVKLKCGWVVHEGWPLA